MMWRVVLASFLVSVAISPAVVSADDRGWNYLIDKLTADGVSRERVVETFRDSRVDRFTGLDFSPRRPREPRALYRRLLRPRTVTAARRCRARHADAFENAERTHGVPASLLAAILYVETGCGHNTGSQVIFTRLARLAMANAPDNLQRNLDRYTDGGGSIDPRVAVQLRDRAGELERTFYPEVRALFTVAERMGVAPLDIRGSSAGAFGYPQFLPTSYLEDGVDADGDGRVSLYDPADAVASCARYLVHHGWRPGLGPAERRAVVWQYNHSDAYVDTIFALATRIRSGVPARTMVATRPHRPRQASVRRVSQHGRPHRPARAKPLGS